MRHPPVRRPWPLAYLHVLLVARLVPPLTPRERAATLLALAGMTVVALALLAVLVAVMP